MSSEMRYTDEQLAGLRLMVGFEGLHLNDTVRRLIDQYKVGGVILFATNLESPDQIGRLCEDIQAYAAQCGQPPLFVAIDQEGGEVARLKPPFTQFAGNPSMRGPADAIHFAQVTARELTGIGINMDMAPVLDVADASLDSIMAGRAFGDDPRQVAALGVAIIEHLQKAGIMAVGKHFPGIGRTELDSHVNLPVCHAGSKNLDDVDLVPFAAAIQADVAGVMLSHILFPALDPHWPASLSPRVVVDGLRRKMGYEGVVMTDDLDMGAICKHFPIETAVDQALKADVDLVLVCHEGPAIETAYEKILHLIRADAQLSAGARRSAQRIEALKRRYLLQPEMPV